MHQYTIYPYYHAVFFFSFPLSATYTTRRFIVRMAYGVRCHPRKKAATFSLGAERKTKKVAKIKEDELCLQRTRTGSLKDSEKGGEK